METVFIMARRNYKIAAYIGLHKSSLARFVVVLDTGAGSSFIRQALIPESHRKLIKPLDSEFNVKDANNRRVVITGTINLAVQVGTRQDVVKFNVVERLGTDIILGCDFCDKHVEAIRPRKRLVELDDGSSVPILKRPEGRAKNAIPLPAEQEYVSPKGRSSDRVYSTQKVVLKPGQQNWITVKTPQSGLVSIEPHKRLYETSNCAACNGIAQVEPDQPFKIMVTNFGTTPVLIRKDQRVAVADPHPTAITESNITHAEVFGITEEDKQSYRKRQLSARDTALINKHLSDLRESHMKEDEAPMTADDIDLSEVDEKYHDQIRSMLKKHETMWSGKLGEINVAEHSIELKDGAKPFKSAPYRSGPKNRELEEFELKKQLEAGIIEPSNSEWAAPVLFVPKKDGRLRFCVDYRKLNEMTLKDSYPLPRMDDCIDSLGHAEYFTTLDAYSGYWQMYIRKQDRSKTAFVTHSGTYQYIRMPFGLTNAPASFQRALDMILTNYKWKTCLVYLDDIIVFSNSIEEHIRHVDEILDCLKRSGITLKIKKCKFFTKSVEYLGHIIRPGRLEIDHAHTASLKEALPPKNKSELRSFLGLCNVYRRFVHRFSHVSGPLNELLKKNSSDSFTLNETQLESFQNLIGTILSPPALSLPRRDLPYSVDTDASAYGLGCSLFQTDEENQRHTIGYWSRSLVPAEKNYSAPERECLGVVWALKTLRAYLLYEEFTVHTDHSALRWLLTIQEPSGRLMRWRLRLAEYNFQIKYKTGTTNVHADALSRLRTNAETVQDDWDEIPSFLLEDDPSDVNENNHDLLVLPTKLRFKQRFSVYQHDCQHTGMDSVDDLLNLDEYESDELFATLPSPVPSDPTFEPISVEELATAQFTDAFCVDIRRRLNEGVVLPFGFNEDGLLCRQVTHEQIVIPHSLKQRVLHINHYSRLAGHPGGRKLYQVIRKDMYWPALAIDCYATVRRCSTCAKNRMKLRQHVQQLQLFPASGPLESVAIDILGELIKTARGNQYLLVISDRFTKLTKTVPLKGQSAAEVAKAFVDHWVFNYGPPSDLLADNGKCFTAKFFQDVCRILNVHNTFTTTYHPQTNGQVERYNRTLKAAIRSYLDEHPTDWDLYTSSLTYAYNCLPHSSTDLAPFELVLSRPPPPLALKNEPRSYKHPQEARIKWKEWLEKALSGAKNRLMKAQQRYKRNYDARLRKQNETIKKNDHVYLRVERRDENEHRHKLAAVAEGPFKVMETHDKTVVIERNDKTIERVSRDRVALAPTPKTLEELQNVVRPMTDEELTPDAYPTSEKSNLCDLSKNQSPTDTTVQQRITRSRSKELLAARDRSTTDPTVQTQQNDNERSSTNGDPSEYVIDRIVSHGINDDADHPSADVGETTYRIRWYGYSAKDDTYEPIRHLPRNKVVSYYKRKKLPVPNNIEEAQQG